MCTNFRIMLFLLLLVFVDSCKSPTDEISTRAEFESIQDSLGAFFNEINYVPPLDYILFIEANVVCKGCTETKKKELESIMTNGQLNLPVVYMCEQSSDLEWADSLGLITKKIIMNDFDSYFPFYANLNLYVFRKGKLKFYKELGVTEITKPLSNMINLSPE